jgi:hypothetical protein
MPEWEPFAIAVRRHHDDRQEPQSVLLQQAVPEISSVLYSTREALLHLGATNHSAAQQHHSTVQQQLATLMTSVNTLATSKITISMPGELIGHFDHTPQVNLLFFF